MTSLAWRQFWVCLNCAYVLEFFLQTLVKRGMLAQAMQLMLNQVLMGISSVSALPIIIDRVRPGVALVSLVLNFLNRGQDIFNTMAIGLILGPVLI